MLGISNMISPLKIIFPTVSFNSIFMVHQGMSIRVRNEMKGDKSMQQCLFVPPIHFQINFQITIWIN